MISVGGRLRLDDKEAGSVSFVPVFSDPGVGVDDGVCWELRLEEPPGVLILLGV